MSEIDTGNAPTTFTTCCGLWSESRIMTHSRVGNVLPRLVRLAIPSGCFRLDGRFGRRPLAQSVHTLPTYFSAIPSTVPLIYALPVQSSRAAAHDAYPGI